MTSIHLEITETFLIKSSLHEIAQKEAPSVLYGMFSLSSDYYSNN